MHQRWIAFPLAATLVACTDDPTAPDSRPTSAPLSLPEYALQLRGDPFLSNIAARLGQPELANRVDEAVLALNQNRAPGSVATLLASDQVPLFSSASDDTSAPVTEEDILSAVIAVTLDRISELNAEPDASAGPSAPTSSDPPPSP